MIYLLALPVHALAKLKVHVCKCCRLCKFTVDFAQIYRQCTAPLFLLLENGSCSFTMIYATTWRPNDGWVRIKFIPFFFLATITSFHCFRGFTDILLSIGAASNETDCTIAVPVENKMSVEEGNAEATDRSINKTVGLKDQ